MGLHEQLALLERSPISTWITRVEPYGPMWANPRGLEFWQAASLDELLARDFSDASETTLEQLRTWQRDFGSGELDELVLDWTLYPRGVPERMKIYISALELDDGQLAFLMQCVPKDSDTDAKILRDAEAMRHTSAAVALLSEQGELLTINPAAIRDFGRDTRFREWFEDLTIADTVLAVATHGETLTQLVCAHIGETRRHYTLEARRTRDPVSGDAAILVHLLDETARVGAEREAEEKAALVAELGRALATVEHQRERWQALVNSAPELIMIVNHERRVEFTNRGLGPASSEACVGQLLEALFDPGSRGELVAALEQVLETGEVAAFEARDRGGTEARSYGVRLGPIVAGSPPSETQPSANARVQRLVLIASDTSERRALEAQLGHAQKMQAMGRLAGGVAHDFNNLLTVIMGVCELAEFEIELDAQPEVAEMFADIAAAAVRGSTLTRQLLDFSRKRPLATAPVELNALVRDMSKMFMRLLGDEIELRLALTDCPCWIRANHGQIEQVIMNLVVNARDAMPEGGELRITTWAPTPPEPTFRLEVTDSGVGMNPELCARIFEPFFTTKSHGKGSGLGLATAHSIVEQSGGSIRVHSHHGEGTRFELRFPVVEDPKGEPAGC